MVSLIKRFLVASVCILLVASSSLAGERGVDRSGRAGLAADVDSARAMRVFRLHTALMLKGAGLPGLATCIGTWGLADVPDPTMTVDFSTQAQAPKEDEEGDEEGPMDNTPGNDDQSRDEPTGFDLRPVLDAGSSSD